MPKRGFWQFSYLREVFVKKTGWCFWRGDTQINTILRSQSHLLPMAFLFLSSFFVSEFRAAFFFDNFNKIFCELIHVFSYNILHVLFFPFAWAYEHLSLQRFSFLNCVKQIFRGLSLNLSCVLRFSIIREFGKWSLIFSSIFH